MPKTLPKLDPSKFADRLSRALIAGGWPDERRGWGARLGKLYGSSTVTANAWLAGTHMPSAERVLAMADDLNQDFEYLYFGRAPKSGAQVRDAKASQPERPSPAMLQDAMELLDELDAIAGRKTGGRPHPYRLAMALEVVSAGSIEGSKSVVVRLADRLRQWEKEHGDE